MAVNEIQALPVEQQTRGRKPCGWGGKLCLVFGPVDRRENGKVGGICSRNRAFCVLRYGLLV